VRRRLTAPLALAAALCAFAAAPAGASAAAPAVLLTTVSHVTTTAATLEAEINPGGNKTNYHFEYGPSDCSAGPCTKVPFPKDATIEAGVSPVRVSAPIEGLTPGTTYHLRVVAKSATPPTAEGPDRTFTTRFPAPVFGPCPNEAFRGGAGAALPDCRAYEQASPVDKNGGDLWSKDEWMAASPDGDSVTFFNDAGIPGAVGAQQIPLYLAGRGAGGWSTQGLNPPAGAGQDSKVIGWTPDLSHFYEEATRQGLPSTKGLLDRSSADGSLATVLPYAPDAYYYFAGASAGGAVALFETGANYFASPVSGKPGVYAWERASGKLSQVSVFNDGTAPAKGAFAGPYDWVNGTSAQTLERGGPSADYYTRDAPVISADGSAAYFTASGTGQLYLRRNPAKEQSKLDGAGNCLEPELACTFPVSASERTPPDPVGTRPAAFQAADADGTKAFFTSSEELTDDANTGPVQEPARIASSDLEGNNINPSLVPTHAKGIAVDDTYIYWANPGQSTIGRARLDGSQPPESSFIATGPGRPQYVAVDAGYLYWTNAADGETPAQFPKTEGGTIGRAQLNGEAAAGDVKPGFITEDSVTGEGLSAPQGIAVDGEHIYWANPQAGDKSIGRADLNGENADLHYIELPIGETPQGGVAVDATHIYYITRGNGGGSFIIRRNLTGPAEEKFTGSNSVDKPDFRGLALDASHLYWANQASGTIGRTDLDLSNLEFTNAEKEFIHTGGAPIGLAADASHLYWSVNGESPPNPGNDLYRYEFAKPAGERLSDLTPDSADVNGAEVRGVLGASADGSYVYFAANGVLAQGATPGDCQSNGGTEAGSCNIYLAHGGEIDFIARADAKSNNWQPRGVTPTNSRTPREARVTPDGQTLLFRGEYLYRYRAPEQTLRCITCNPTGEEPGSSSSITQPGSITVTPSRPASELSRFFSDDGQRVFFETTAALVGADTNGAAGCPLRLVDTSSFYSCQDVYEWEAPGTGSCHSENENGGCFYLLSGGSETEPSFFGGASATGDDVFIFTRSPLVGQDTDNLRDVYDVRVGGGLAAQNQPPPVNCVGEACKGELPAAPGDQSPGSGLFVGAGDPPPSRPKCRKGFVRKHGRCVKKAGHRKDHKRDAKQGGRAGQ